MKILIFIPTFNDRLLIASLVKSILALGVEFYTLVIDDGSDPALEIDGLSGPREKYFRCPYNVGLGVTTNIALDYAQKEQFDIFLRIDADGQHPLDCIPPIIKASNIKNIENFCYMHGQIYETHKEIFNSNPRNYIVWGNFFYKMVNKYAPNTNVIKVKYPYFNFKINKKLKQNKNKIKKILFIEEYQGDVEIYNNIFKNLKNKYLFFYRPKLRSTIKNKIDNIEILNPKINILESIRNNNIDLVIGTSSNILLESYLVDVLSASVEKKNNLLSFYQTKYKLVYNLNLISVDKDLHYIFKNYKKLLDKYKQRTWGNEKKI